MKKKISISDIKRYYFDQQLSAIETAKKLNVSLRRIYKFMNKNNLPRRTSSSTRSIQFNKSKKSFSKTKLNTKFLNNLYIASTMLYWAEGYKIGKNTVDFANSNKLMLLVFLNALRKIYNVQESKIKIYLYCFSNQDQQDLLNFWSKTLNIPLSQFTKPYIKSGSLNKNNHYMSQGLIHIRYSDTRLLTEINSDIDIISKSLCWDGGAVNHTTL